jgi:GNAT superfamily N-acetyltransferase
MTEPVVRPATDADLDRATETLALAHHTYEWAVWAFPRPDRLTLLHGLFRIDAQIGIALGSAWVTDDIDSVAIWSPPSTARGDPPGLAALRDQQDALIGPDVGRLHAADRMTRAHRPTQPYWYLGTVGTRPDRRGCGLASAVIAPVLGLCDTDGVAACLETSSEANVRLYERMGFDTVFRTTADDGRLSLIVMHRQPR